VVLADPALRERINSLAARVARRTEASLAQAERELTRNQKLMTDGFITQQMMERTRLEADVQSAALNEAKASLAEQQRYLDEMTVRAPTAGTILVRTIERVNGCSRERRSIPWSTSASCTSRSTCPNPISARSCTTSRHACTSMPSRTGSSRRAFSKIASEAEFTPEECRDPRGTRETRVCRGAGARRQSGGTLKPGMRPMPWCASKTVRMGHAGARQTQVVRSRPRNKPARASESDP